MPPPTTDTVSYLYDNSGALAPVIDSGSGISTTYYYDFIDRLAKYVEKGTDYSHSVEYGFDSKNNLSTQKETINGITRTTDYSYDADNRLDTLTAEGHTVDYTYDGFGRIEKQEVKNGTQTVLTMEYTYYDLEENKTSVQVKSIEYTADNYSITYTYTYDGNGNILSISDGTNTYQYEYTDGNKLYRENDPITGVSKSYLYADTGNPYVEIQRPYVNGTVGSEETYISYSWDSTWGDMLTYYGDIPLYYDTVGNMTGDGTYTYTWEHGRELATMTDSTGIWAFTYDANGMRTKRVKTNTSGTVTDTYTYVYNGSQLSQMTKNGQTLNFFYDGEGRPAYFTYNNATYYYVTNLQGDVIAILDSTGAVMVNYHYDAYGVLLQTGGTMASTLGTLNPLTYRGYVYDHDTGLYYLQSRYYNPAIRQFISADAYISTGQGYLGYNMFAYSGNNPVKNCDSAGTYYVSIEDRFGPGYIDGGSTPQVAPQPSYINSQYNDEIENKRFGLATVGHGGCGAVATYNALIDLGAGRSFDSVLDYYNWGLGTRLFLFGYGGTLPINVGLFFIRAGYNTVITHSPYMINELSKTADACILYYEWVKGAVGAPYNAHFISYHRTEGGYEWYNPGGFFRQPTDFLDSQGATWATGIFIFK